MKKLIIALIFLLSIIILCSCTKEELASDMINKRLNILSQDKGEQNTVKIFEQILDSIKNKDDVALKKLFSAKALDENLDENINNLFEFIEGDIISWERESGGESTSVQNGHKINEVQFYACVTTNKEKYIFSTYNIIEDTLNTKNKGICFIMVVRIRDEKKVYDPKNNMFFKEVDGKKVKIEHQGIYIPIK